MAALIMIIFYYVHLVSGEANFTMHYTGLTVGGFTQPSVARNILEHHANVEKGLCQCFLWLVPKPTNIAFEDLYVHTDFSTAIGKYTRDKYKKTVCIYTYVHVHVPRG